jgi:hypothetical protein
MNWTYHGHARDEESLNRSRVHYMRRHLLRILAGALDFVASGIALYFIADEFGSWGYSGVHSLDDFLTDFPLALRVVLPPAAAIVGALLSGVGGFCAVSGRRWRLALAGSAFTLLTPISYLVVSLIWTHTLLSYVAFLVGVAAIVSTLMSKRYFVREVSST